MKIFAHRAGKDHFPELTIAAARHSLALGADMVEMDIRFAGDGVPVISHDRDAGALFGVDRQLADMTAEQFRSLTFVENRNCHPHTLEEVLSSGVAPILFHVKEGGERLQLILQLIRQADCEGKAVIGVTAPEDIEQVKRFNERMMTLAFMPRADQLADFLAGSADAIRLWENWLSHDAVRQIKQAGKEAWVMSGSAHDGSIGRSRPDNLTLWKQWGVDGVLVDRVQDYIAYK